MLHHLQYYSLVACYLILFLLFQSSTLTQAVVHDASSSSSSYVSSSTRVLDTDDDSGGQQVHSGPDVVAHHVARWLQDKEETSEGERELEDSLSLRNNTTFMNGTNTTTNTTIDEMNVTSFDSVVVVTIDKDFKNATVDEIIQFQNDFKFSYNSANGINNNTTNITTTTTTTTDDPLGREIINVTVDFNFTFNPGLVDVPIDAVRERRNRELFDDRILDTTTSAAAAAAAAATANSNATIDLPVQRYIQIVLFISAMCTRCPADQSLFDDVSSTDDDNNDVIRFRKLEQEQPTELKKNRGPTLKEVLSILATTESGSSYEVGTLVEVESFECPTPSNMFYTEIVLPLSIDYSIATSTQGQIVLEELFLRSFNELTQADNCDPYYRTIQSVQIDGIVSTNDIIDNNNEGVEGGEAGMEEGDPMNVEIIEMLFLVEVYCMGVDCEQFGHNLFDDPAEPSRQRTRRQSRTNVQDLSPSQEQEQQQQLLRSTTTGSRREYPPGEQFPTFRRASKATHPFPTEKKEKSSIMRKNRNNHRHLYEDEVMMMRNNHNPRRKLQEEERCYCNVQSIANNHRAPTRQEFLKIYQQILDNAQEKDDTTAGVATVPPSTAPSNSPTVNPTAPLIPRCGINFGGLSCPEDLPTCSIIDGICTNNLEDTTTNCEPIYSFPGTCFRCGASFDETICPVDLPYCTSDDSCSSDIQFIVPGACQVDYSFSDTCGRCGASYEGTICGEDGPWCSEFDYCGVDPTDRDSCQPDYSFPGTCFRCGKNFDDAECPVNFPYCTEDDYCSSDTQFIAPEACQVDYSFPDTCGRCGASFEGTICSKDEPWCSEFGYCGTQTSDRDSCQPDYSFRKTCFRCGEDFDDAECPEALPLCTNAGFCSEILPEYLAQGPGCIYDYSFLGYCGRCGPGEWLGTVCALPGEPYCNDANWCSSSNTDYGCLPEYSLNGDCGFADGACGASAGGYICESDSEPWCNASDECSGSIEAGDRDTCQPDFSKDGTCFRCGSDFDDAVCPEALPMCTSSGGFCTEVTSESLLGSQCWYAYSFDDYCDRCGDGEGGIWLGTICDLPDEPYCSTWGYCSYDTDCGCQPEFSLDGSCA